MRLSRLLLVGVLAAVALAAGCGGSSSSSRSVTTAPATTAAPHSGWVVYAPSGKGFRMALPAGWKPLNPTNILSTSQMQAALHKHGINAATVQQMLRVAASGAYPLLAVDLSQLGMLNARRSGSLAVIGMNTGPVPAGATAEALARVGERSITVVEAHFSNQPIELPASSGVIATFTGNGASGALSGVYYAFVHNRTGYLLLMAGPTEAAQTYLPLFRSIAQTLRFTG